MEKYKRSKTDSVLYCPYCGKTFRMTYDRYMAAFEAYRRRELYALTECKACHESLWFRNLTPEAVRSGKRAVLKYDERG